MADKKGFFPWKVQDIVSAVSTAIDEAIEASHEPASNRRRAPQKWQNPAPKNTPTPKAAEIGETKDVVMEEASVQTPANEPTKVVQEPPSTQVAREIPRVTPQKTVPEPELVSEQAQNETHPIVEFTKEEMEPKTLIFPDNDWELLSERGGASTTSHSASASAGFVGGGEIFVARAGSVRSITSIDQSNNSSQTTLSVPFKIQRTLSSSTIDSQDNTLGPSGQGVLGVDYVEHIVLPTDTLQGICIAYKVSASSLRRANHFTGHSLHCAPKKLLIPLSKQALRTGFIRVQDTDSKEYKLHYFQAEFPGIHLGEAKAYLELADWELEEALQSAKEDREWEKEDAIDDFKGGQIGVKFNFKGGKPFLKLRGIGGALSGKKKKEVAPTPLPADIQEEEFIEQPKPKQKVVIHSKLPSIATKSVLAEDLFRAAPEHSNFGLELQTLSRRQNSETAN